MAGTRNMAPSQSGTPGCAAVGSAPVSGRLGSVLGVLSPGGASLGVGVGTTTTGVGVGGLGDGVQVGVGDGLGLEAGDGPGVGVCVGVGVGGGGVGLQKPPCAIFPLAQGISVGVGVGVQLGVGDGLRLELGGSCIPTAACARIGTAASDRMAIAMAITFPTRFRPMTSLSL